MRLIVLLNVLFALFSCEFVFADAPVVWSGSTVKWLPSALQSAGVCSLSSSGIMTSLAPGANGNILTSNGTAWTSAASPTAVTSISIASANGFSGSSSGGTTPALTLQTTISGILKGNGTAISAAVSGTDYAPATSGSAILKGNGAGGFSNAASGTDYAPATSGSAVLKGNGSGGFSAATDADITGKVLTGYASGAGTVSATDSILQAIQKLNGNTAAISSAATSIGTVSATPTANALDITSNVLTAHYADGTNPGLLSSTTQTIGGAKTFSADLTMGGNITIQSTSNNSLTGANARIPSHTTGNIYFTNASLTSIGSANNGGVSDGHRLGICNNTGATITIVNNYGSAAAGEAIFTGTGADHLVVNKSCLLIQYSSTSSAWQEMDGGITNLAGTAVTGILSIPNGGTNQSSFTSGYGTYFDGTRLNGSSTFLQYDGSGHTGIGGAVASPYPLKVTGVTNTAKGYGVQITAPQAVSSYLLDFETNGAIRNFQFGSGLTSDTGLLLTSDSAGTALQSWQAGRLGFGSDSASRVPQYSFDFSQTATSTAPLTDIVKASGTYNLPIIMSRNTSNTANAYAGYAMAGTSMNPVGLIYSTIETQTAASESAHISFAVKNAGTMAEQLRIAKDGTITFYGYGSGIPKMSSGTFTGMAISGTDYAPATSGSNILYGNGAGGFSGVTIGSGLTFSAGTLSASGGGGGSGASTSFTLDGAVIPFTTINGAFYVTASQTLSSISIAAVNTGTSGSTTVQVNQWRSGALFNSATASLAASSGNPGGTNTALSGSLSLASGDTITVDVNSAAVGASDLTVNISTPTAVTNSSTLNSASYAIDTPLTNSNDVIACNGTVKLTMQAASSATIKRYSFKNIGAGICTIVPAGSDTIDGDTTGIVLGTKFDSVTLIPDGSAAWYVY